MGASVKTPMLFRDCLSVYERMSSAARHTAKGVTWQGYILSMYEELGIEKQRHSTIMPTLERMRCIRWLARPARNRPGEAELLKVPTIEDYRAAGTHAGTRRSKTEIYGKRFYDIEERLRKLEEVSHEH